MKLEVTALDDEKTKLIKSIVNFLYNIDEYSIDKETFVTKFLKIYEEFHKVSRSNLEKEIDYLISINCISRVQAGGKESPLIKVMEKNCLERKYLDVVDISEKISYLKCEFKNLKEIIDALKEDNVKLKRLIKEFNKSKLKMIEIMSIFISTFALIMGNINILNNVNNINNFTYPDIISSLFLGNATIIISILTLILLVDIILSKEEFKEKKKYIFLIPLILLVIGFATKLFF